MPDVPTPKHALPQPADGDFINTWPAQMRAALGDLDALIAAAIEDDPRPAAGVFGRFHRAADGTISFDTGAAWVELPRMPHAARHSESGDDPLPGQAPIGAVIAYAGVALPPNGAWAWADGALVDRTTFAEFFARVGHAYNGGVDPGANKVRLPDKRGRVPMGADNFGAGAAGRLPNTTNKARGQGGGAELHGHSVNGHTHQHMASTGHSGGSARVIDDGDAVLDAVGSYAHYDDVVVNHAEVGVMNAASASSVAIVTSSSAAPGTNNVSSLQPYEVDNYIVRIA